MGEIQGIQHQLMIAQIGRPGVRTGGTIECLRETLKETEEWPIEESHFGTLTAAAQNAKASVIESISGIISEREKAERKQAPPAAAYGHKPPPPKAPGEEDW